MAKYIVFYRRTGRQNPVLEECIGTGSIILPDQRFSIDTLISKVYSKYFVIPKDADAFIIGHGNNIFDIKPYTGFYYFGDKDVDMFCHLSRYCANFSPYICDELCEYQPRNDLFNIVEQCLQQ